MKAKMILLIVALLFTSIQTFAGWYDTYHYHGWINQYPVTLSIQIKEGYFGESAKKGYNVIGVYKYDKFNNPIRLEGTLNRSSGVLKIHELGAGERVTATLLLKMTDFTLDGTWSNGKNKWSVNLKLENKLSDLGSESFDHIAVLQFPSLKDYYFVGIYAKKSGDEDAQMTSLNIVSKTNQRVFQILNFDNIEAPTGNLMTIIYDNITVGKGNDFIISNRIGRVGGYLTVTYHQKSKRFILDPEPVAEGVNH